MKNKQTAQRFTILFFLVTFTIIITIYPTYYVEGFIHDKTSNDTYGSGLNNEKSKIFIQSMIDKVNLFSFEYQNELLNWQTKTHDNKTIFEETRRHMANLEETIADSKNFSINDNYKPILDMYAKSLQSEIDSYDYFLKSILTENSTEKKIFMKTSDELLSSALTYEMQALNQFKKINSE